ncbi:uncharacterized protein LOC114957203 [Acropora millepora]|uniref:uncharacterized protein LOC114957203 n=1 Tax=Acropora millepora TaxID=45264 RepID=UPI001CF3EEB3|nr:uncharacterized protein LOC114957203 [Acropora millepora]
MFNSCEPCARFDGFECENESFSLSSGHWWKWDNETTKKLFISFRQDLSKNLPSENLSVIEYPYPLPQSYKCPRPESCLGGMESNCDEGYQGPLCEVCRHGYYKQLKTCKKCPSKSWIVGQLCIIAAVIIVIALVVVWRSKKQMKKKSSRRLGDLILSKTKIVIGFYQVTFGVVEAFAFIKWPDSLTFIGKYSEMLQLNVLQIAPIHCLYPNLKVDAFKRLYAILSINAAIIILGFAVYSIRKVLITRKAFEIQEDKVKKILETKQMTYRAVFFFLYVTYLSTCSKTASVLPLACRTLCYMENETDCDAFLRADFTINCSNQEFRRSVIVAYCSVLYIILLPTASLLILWRHRKTLKTSSGEDEDESAYSQSPAVITGLRFLFQNYTSKAWYWEFVETARKVILTSGIILLKEDTRTYVGMACTMSGVYGMMFAFKKPIRDPSENALMMCALAVTFFNLLIGAVSRIPTEGVLLSVDAYMDHDFFTVLVIGANVLVIGILVFQYIRFIYDFYKKWRENPQWSFSCCLALLLPLSNLQQDILGMTEKNILKEQLQTGTIDMPSVTGVLKDTGAVAFDLSSIEEHPKETIVSIYEETETDKKMDENADKGAFNIRDEPRKSHLPQEDLEKDVRVITGKKVLKRQMKTGRFNMPSVSGALKKGGEVRIVVASVHEPPKPSRGPSTTEKEDGETKEGNNDKIACNTSAEPDKSPLSQDDIQGKKKEKTAETVLKEQPKTANAKKPPVSGAVKKRKVVRFDLSNIEERPNEVILARSDEAESGQKIIGNAEKEACFIRDEPRKSHSPEDLEQDVRVITGKKVLKRQMKTGKVNMPLVSGALKKSGEVRVVVASVHAPPKQSKGPSTTEKGGGGMKEGNDDKVACNIGEEPEKRLLPQDDLSQKVIWMKQKHVLKQQLENTNVDISSVSGALKKSGEVRIAVKPPKKTRGSSTKEMEGGGMKEGRNDKVTSNTGEEPERSLLPQDDFPRKMQVMTGENVLKQQLQTANVDKPSVSGALKKTKEVSFELSSIEEHPKETSGSRIKETEL